MAKYRIPIQVISYTEVEADNLSEAINDINTGCPDVEGVQLPFVDEWQIDNYNSVFKNGEVIQIKEYEDLLLADVTKEEDLKKY